MGTIYLLSMLVEKYLSLYILIGDFLDKARTKLSVLESLIITQLTVFIQKSNTIILLVLIV